MEKAKISNWHNSAENSRSLCHRAAKSSCS